MCFLIDSGKCSIISSRVTGLFLQSCNIFINTSTKISRHVTRNANPILTIMLQSNKILIIIFVHLQILYQISPSRIVVFDQDQYIF